MIILNPYDLPALDRRAERRAEPGWLDALLGDPETRLVPVWRGRSLIGRAPHGPEAVIRRAGEIDWHRHAAVAVALGEHQGAAYVAVDLSGIEAPESHPSLAGHGEFQDLRGMGFRLGHAEGALLAYARGMIWFHARHRFCGVCGAPTEPREAGHSRVCTDPTCAVQVFPRNDPAVIVLVADGDRCLLGRSGRFAEGMHSVLAGFVEAGESLEATIRREIREEAGIEVTDLRYHSSQPWPFPQSLMVGFLARAATREIRIDADELVEADWYSRDFLLGLDRDARPGEAPFTLPPRHSIARRLIEDWLAAGG